MKPPQAQRTLVLIFISTAMLLSLFLPTATAAVAQWFPGENTVVEYNVIYGTLSISGDYSESTQFDVYNSSMRLFVRPTSLNYSIDTSTYTSIANDTPVRIRHAYKANTATEWLRTRSIIVGGVEYDMMSLGWEIQMHDSNYSYYGITAFEESVQKTGFFAATHLPDHVNNSAALGEVAFNIFRVSVISRTEIISQYNITDITYELRNTIISSLDGRVKRMVRGFHSSGYESWGVHSTFVIYEEVSASGFQLTPEMLVFLLIGLGGGIAAGIGIGYGAAITAAKKRK